MKKSILSVVVAIVAALCASCAAVSAIRPCQPVVDSPTPAETGPDARRFTFSIDGPRGWTQVNEEVNRMFVNSISMVKGDGIILIAFFPSEESATSAAGQLMTVTSSGGSNVFDLQPGQEMASFRWKGHEDMGKVEVRRLADGLVVEIIGVWTAGEDVAMRLDFDQIRTVANWEK